MSVIGLSGDVLADVVLLNRAVYGGADDLPPDVRADYDPARDPSDAGIRPALNVYDRYDLYLALFGLTTLGAAELGFGPGESSTQDDLLPGDGMGIDRSWFYAGDLYRNHVVASEAGPDVVYPEAAAVALAATSENATGQTLHLTFRGTDADLGKDGEAGTAPGQVRYYGQLTPLIEAALAYAADPANDVTEVVVSGHSLGGVMADMFALYHGADFEALPGVELQVVSLASPGIDPGTFALGPDYDPALVEPGPAGLQLVTPDWYASYDHAGDIVRNPERYDYPRHQQTDPEQAPVTRAATATLLEHVNFEGNRLEVEMPLLDQYALSPKLDTNFLPQHYASLYEMIGSAMAASIDAAKGMSIDLTGLRGQNGGAPLDMSDLLVGSAAGAATVELDLNGDGRADQWDLDGDGRADLVQVRLSGVAPGALDAGDFLF